MRVTKKCAICGNVYTYDNDMAISPYIKPTSVGSQYYYDLWHFMVEDCPECGYASCDISTSKNKLIITDPKYKAVTEMPIVKDIANARPNMVDSYLKASIYYENIGDILLKAKCMLQASDLIYAELMYWNEYVLDSSNSLSAIQSKSQYNEFRKFADNLFTRAVEDLENYVNTHPSDIDTYLLLAGTLGDGNKVQALKGARMLNTLSSMPISREQKKCLDYLLSEIN